MRITHVIQNPKIGGVQKFVEALIPFSEFQNDFYSVIFTRDGQGELLTRYKSKNVHVYNFPGKLKPFRPYRLYSWAITRYSHFYNPLFLKYVQHIKPDMVHTHIASLPEVVGHLNACTKLKVPFVWTIHGMIKYCDAHIESLQKAIEQAIDRSLPMTITYVGAQPDLFNDLNLGDRISVMHIPPGIDLAEFTIPQGMREKNRRIYGFSENEFVLGYIGRLSMEKGVDILLGAINLAMKQAPQLRLIIAGDGPERLELERRLLRLQCKEKVLFIGEIKDVRDILSLLDGYVQPSRQEGLPLSILESMTAGIPIIATNVGGVPSVIKDGISGLLVLPEDPFSIFRAIINLVEDDQLRRRISIASQQNVLPFDISKIRQQYHRIYQNLLLK